MAFATTDYERLLSAARALAREGRRMTAGYGAMDVAEEAYARSGVVSEFGSHDLSVAQVRGIWDAYHELAPRP